MEYILQKLLFDMASEVILKIMKMTYKKLRPIIDRGLSRILHFDFRSKIISFVKNRTMEKPNKERIGVTLDVSPLTKAVMEKMASLGMDLGKETDAMFLEFADDLGWMTHDEEGNPVALIERNNK